MNKVVGLNGEKFEVPQKETDIAGLLVTLQNQSTKYNGCVIVMLDSTGKESTIINWVGLSPLEVVGALASSESMILKGGKQPTQEKT